MAKAKTKPEEAEAAIPTAADLKKIANRIAARAPKLADAEAQYECAKVAARNRKAELDKLRAEDDADRDLLALWAKANPDAIDAAPKNAVDLGKGLLVVKNCPASIKNLDGWDDDDVIAACEKQGLDAYVNVKKTLARTVVKNDWNAQRITDKELRKIGLYPDCGAKPEFKLKD